MFSKCPCILIQVKLRFNSPLKGEFSHFDMLEHKRNPVKLDDINILNVLFCYHIKSKSNRNASENVHCIPDKR